MDRIGEFFFQEPPKNPTHRCRVFKCAETRGDTYELFQNAGTPRKCRPCIDHVLEYNRPVITKRFFHLLVCLTFDASHLAPSHVGRVLAPPLRLWTSHTRVWWLMRSQYLLYYGITFQIRAYSAHWHIMMFQESDKILGNPHSFSETREETQKKMRMDD